MQSCGMTKFAESFGVGRALLLSIAAVLIITGAVTDLRAFLAGVGACALAARIDGLV